MSEQNKSNLQALVAGLVGFAAVVAIGGGALFIHSKLLGGASASRPAPAAAPIDLGSSMPRPITPLSERREQSPAPLVGADESVEAAAPSEARAGSAGSAESSRAAASSAVSARADGRPALKASEHLTAEASSSAEARVEDKAKAEEKAAAKAPAKLAKKAAAAPSGDGAAGGEAAVASVTYGVKSRNELMGRAAGPVYNFQGAGKGGTTAGSGKVAGDVGATIADIKKQLSNTNLPPEQRDALMKQLDAAGSADVEAAPR